MPFYHTFVKIIIFPFIPNSLHRICRLWLCRKWPGFLHCTCSKWMPVSTVFSSLCDSVFAYRGKIGNLEIKVTAWSLCNNQITNNFFLYREFWPEQTKTNLAVEHANVALVCSQCPRLPGCLQCLVAYVCPQCQRLLGCAPFFHVNHFKFPTYMTNLFVIGR